MSRAMRLRSLARAVSSFIRANCRALRRRETTMPSPAAEQTIPAPAAQRNRTVSQKYCRTMIGRRKRRRPTGCRCAAPGPRTRGVPAAGKPSRWSSAAMFASCPPRRADASGRPRRWASRGAGSAVRGRGGVPPAGCPAPRSSERTAVRQHRHHFRGTGFYPRLRRVAGSAAPDYRRKAGGSGRRSVPGRHQPGESPPHPARDGFLRTGHAVPERSDALGGRLVVQARAQAAETLEVQIAAVAQADVVEIRQAAEVDFEEEIRPVCRLSGVGEETYLAIRR